VWSQESLTKAYSAAKLLPARKSRLLAFLKHVSAVSAVLDSIKSPLDRITRCLWRHNARLFDMTAYRRARQDVYDWVTTGDPLYVTKMGMSVSKHPGFDADIGRTKRGASAYFASMAAAALNDAEWAWKRMRVLLHGCRSKLVQLTSPVIGVPAAAASAYLDPIVTYPRIKELFEAERLDSEELSKAQSFIDTLTPEQVYAVEHAPALAADINQNDAKSRMSNARILQDEIEAHLRNLGEYDDGLGRVWRFVEEHAANGNVALEGAVREFTRGNGELREEAWRQALGPLADEPSTVEPSTLASGTHATLKRNSSSANENFAPFVDHGVILGCDDLAEMLAAQSEALRAIVCKSSDLAPLIPKFVTNAEPGSEGWIDDVTSFYCASQVFEGSADDFLLMKRPGPCPRGHGRITDPQHYRCVMPPQPLLERWTAAVGRSATFDPAGPRPHKEDVFFERTLALVRQDGHLIPYSVPDHSDALQTYVSPDATDDALALERTRVPAALSRLLMSYGNEAAWADL
ncbi:unnamed protein product, partial [Prorocentrum cordatum]